MKTSIIRNVSFEDVWFRLTNDESHLCCTRKFSDDGWESFVAWNPVATYSSNRNDPIDEFKKFVKSEQEKKHRVFGYLSYDLGYSLFNINPHAKNDMFLPEVFFYGFDSYITFISDGIKVVSLDESTLNAYISNINTILDRPLRKRKVYSTAHESAELVASTTQDAYFKSYDKVKKYIIEGDIYQMNLTHRLQGRTKKNARELFMDMCEKNKVDCIAYIEGDEFEVLSASPERFIRVDVDRIIETFPIKGTRPRGKNREEDDILKQELIHSEKEAAELNMITDLLRNDIGKVSEIGSVKVIGSRIIHPYATVWHTYSHIQGKLLPHVSSVEALLAMFPGGSITGCPKKRAMEIIDEVELVMRGVYTGSIGFIDPDDTLDFNIAIRTLIKKNETVFLQVGGGIVYNSNKQDEYQETFDKAKSFLCIL
jgi:para-aminobenzoate synthetase component 1